MLKYVRWLIKKKTHELIKRNETREKIQLNSVGTDCSNDLLSRGTRRIAVRVRVSRSIFLEPFPLKRWEKFMDPSSRAAFLRGQRIN